MTNNKPLNLKSVAKLMANKSSVETLKSDVEIPPNPEDSISDQITEFLKSGNKINKIEPETRAMPEFVWFRSSYPRNYRRNK